MKGVTRGGRKGSGEKRLGGRELLSDTRERTGTRIHDFKDGRLIFARISFAVLVFFPFLRICTIETFLCCNEELHTSTYDFGTREHTTHVYTYTRRETRRDTRIPWNTHTR